VEFHKPKPVHNWRELLTEISVVVIGVIIALGAEQTIEAIHHREIVRQGEQGLRNNFERLVANTTTIDLEASCVAKRSGELRAIIDRAAMTRRLEGVGRIPMPFTPPFQIDTWDAMVASQAVPYLSSDQSISFSRIADAARDISQILGAEGQEWGALKSLEGTARPFSEAEETMARDNLARAVVASAAVRMIADGTVRRIRSSHLLDQEAINRAVAQGQKAALALQMCQQISTPGQPHND
jgi:hypothetical protein